MGGPGQRTGDAVAHVVTGSRAVGSGGDELGRFSAGGGPGRYRRHDSLAHLGRRRPADPRRPAPGAGYGTHRHTRTSSITRPTAMKPPSRAGRHRVPAQVLQRRMGYRINIRIVVLAHGKLYGLTTTERVAEWRSWVRPDQLHRVSLRAAAGGSCSGRASGRLGPGVGPDGLLGRLSDRSMTPFRWPPTYSHPAARPGRSNEMDHRPQPSSFPRPMLCPPQG
jgi:hypothetical protein